MTAAPTPSCGACGSDRNNESAVEWTEIDFFFFFCEERLNEQAPLFSLQCLLLFWLWATFSSLFVVYFFLRLKLMFNFAMDVPVGSSLPQSKAMSVLLSQVNLEHIFLLNVRNIYI